MMATMILQHLYNDIIIADYCLGIVKLLMTNPCSCNGLKPAYDMMMMIMTVQPRILMLMLIRILTLVITLILIIIV